MANKVTASTKPIYTKPAPNAVNVKLVNTSGRYTIGSPKRPNIVHDNGFLDTYLHREPTIAERASHAKLVAKASVGSVIGHDLHGAYLADAIPAYLHFLRGSGSTRTINYRKFLEEDPAGQQCLQYITKDLENHAEVIGSNRTKFSITSEPYQIGGRDLSLPYPETENWQKAIGAHPIWISADIEITYDKKNKADIYTARFVMHVEDRYNFNPGKKDIASGKPDSDNGIYETTGLAKQYLNIANEQFTHTWIERRQSNPFKALK